MKHPNVILYLYGLFLLHGLREYPLIRLAHQGHHHSDKRPDKLKDMVE